MVRMAMMPKSCHIINFFDNMTTEPKLNKKHRRIGNGRAVGIKDFFEKLISLLLLVLLFCLYFKMLLLFYNSSLSLSILFL